jgi:hypothetical protein
MRQRGSQCPRLTRIELPVSPSWCVHVGFVQALYPTRGGHPGTLAWVFPKRGQLHTRTRNPEWRKRLSTDIKG